MVREVECRLTCRIASTDEVNVQSIRRGGFTTCCAVVDTFADQPVGAVDCDAPPCNTGGNDHCSCANPFLSIQHDFHLPGVDIKNGSCNKNFGPQPTCLIQGAGRKLITRHSIRKAQVILYTGRSTCLTAGSFALNNNRAQPFRCTID